LRTAQMRAVSINRDCRVRFPDATSYIMECQSLTGWAAEGGAQPLPFGVQFTAFPPGNNFQFNPDSTASTGGLTLTNTKGSTRRITLTTLTGKITVNPPL
jgi:hypothetical protein